MRKTHIHLQSHAEPKHNLNSVLTHIHKMHAVLFFNS